MTSEPGAVAARVRALAEHRPPTLGTGRLVCVDGPAGSGKTTLAGALGAPTIHTDDLLDGWSGLPTLAGDVEPVLRDLAAGRPARWRRYDWHHGEYAEECRLDPAPLVVLEGVGAGQSAWTDLVTVLVWVEGAPQDRIARGLARDGDAVRPHWERWMRDEQALFARERIRERADLVVPT